MLDHSTAMPVISDSSYTDVPLCMAISRRHVSREEMALASVFRDIELAFAWFLYSTEYFLTTSFDALYKAFISVAVAGCTTAGEVVLSYSRVVFIADCYYFPFSCVMIKNPESFGLFRVQQLGNSLFNDCRARERGWVLGLIALLVDEERGRLVGSEALKTVTCVSGVSSSHKNYSIFKDLANQWCHFRVPRIPAFPGGVSMRRECL
ncbi:MAG: hypothetical protein L0J73_05890 [Halomonas sp.]|nr:hypothetical protein [Halomonas sp.]